MISFETSSSFNAVPKQSTWPSLPHDNPTAAAKRPLCTWNDNHSNPNPGAKRLRDASCRSPTIALVATNCRTLSSHAHVHAFTTAFSASIGRTEASTSNKVNETPKCWWTNNKSQLYQSNDAFCSVCQGNIDAVTAELTTTSSSLSMGIRNLDGYFGKSMRGKSLAKFEGAAYQTAEQQQTMTHQAVTRCHFCVKSLCQNCFHECEQCRHAYCTFCLTSDYAHGLEHVCLDCARDVNDGMQMQIDG